MREPVSDRFDDGWIDNSLLTSTSIKKEKEEAEEEEEEEEGVDST